jgi:hypothetical protein
MYPTINFLIMAQHSSGGLYLRAFYILRIGYIFSKAQNYIPNHELLNSGRAQEWRIINSMKHPMAYILMKFWASWSS